MNRVGILKSTLVSDMEMQGLECSLLVLLMSSISSLCSLSFLLEWRIVMYVLCHCVLKVCDLLFYFAFTEVTVKRLPWVSEKI